MELAEVSVICSASSMIHEGFLDQFLTIIEGPFHLYGRDILSQGGELFFLERADQSRGVEHMNPDPGNVQETIGHCTSGIARGGHQHMDFLVHIPGIVAQEPGQEAGSHILESQGGPVKELQGIEVLFHLDQGGVKIDRILRNGA